MKSTEKKETIALVERMAEISEAMKDMSEEYATIKTHLKSLMAEMDTNVLGAGRYVMIISNRFRKDLNKELVQALLGERYKDCITTAEYQTFEVKKS